MIREQYDNIKSKHPDALLLFRCGDFYETYFSDAENIALLLDLVRTLKKDADGNEFTMCGFPHHSLDEYLPRIIRAGFRIAICDDITER